MISGARRARALAVLLVVLAASLVVAPARAAAPLRRSLTGRLLVATESMGDPRFSRAVLYLGRHDERGALGLVVNIPLGEVPFERALKPLGLEAPPNSGTVRIHYGGPVGERQGFVLHTPDWKAESTTVVNEHFAVTEDPSVLLAMARGAGPRKALFVLGYAGWAPGQLDAEMTTGAWAVAAADERLVFETDPSQKWIEAMARRILEL